MTHASTVLAAVDGLAFNPLNAKDWLLAMGPFAMVGIWLIMFAETGLLLGFFLPGDSLLFLAGVATSSVAVSIGVSEIPFWGLLIGAPIAAISGAQLGHFMGARYGRKLFDNPRSKLFRKLFKQEYVDKAEHYFDKFGAPKAVVLARFMPFVRTFLNPIAGMLGMPARQFLLWNIVGGILWTDGIILVGHFLAKTIIDAIGPDKIDRYILPAVFVIVLISMIPIFVEMAKKSREKRREKANAHG